MSRERSRSKSRSLPFFVRFRHNRFRRKSHPLFFSLISFPKRKLRKITVLSFTFFPPKKYYVNKKQILNKIHYSFFLSLQHKKNKNLILFHHSIFLSLLNFLSFLFSFVTRIHSIMICFLKKKTKWKGKKQLFLLFPLVNGFECEEKYPIFS